MTWLLAEDLLIDPVKVAEELGKAQNVQQVLAIVVGVLLIFLLVVVIYHVKREHHHEAKHETQAAKHLKTWKRVERAISALAGLGDSIDPDEED